MARDRSAITWASLLSVLLHAVVLAIPSSGSSGVAASTRAMVLQVELQRASLLLPASAPDEALVVRVPDDPSQESAPVTELPALLSTGDGQFIQAPPVPAPSAKVYRNGAELHQRPIPLMRIELSDLAREFPGARGRYYVQINETGVVDDVRVGEGSDPALALAYQARLRAMRFVPGKITGQAVASELVIEIRFPVMIVPMSAAPDRREPGSAQVLRNAF